MALGALDRRDDRPPYRQIADQLRAAIERGDLQPGDKLPSEAALMEHYHVARMTARQATIYPYLAGIAFPRIAP